MGLLDILNGIGSSASPAGGTARGGGMSPIMTALLGLLAYKALAGGGAKTSPSGSAASGSLPTGGAAGGSLGDILGSVLGGRLGSAPTGGGAGSGQPGGSLGDILGGVLGGRSGTAPGGNAGGSLGDILGGVLGGRSGGTPAGGGSLGDMLGGLLRGNAGGAQGGNVLSDALSNIVRDLQKSGHGAVAQSWVGTGANQPLDPKELGAALGPDVIAELSQHVGMEQEDLLAALSHHLPPLIDQLTPNGNLPSAEEASQMV